LALLFGECVTLALEVSRGFGFAVSFAMIDVYGIVLFPLALAGVGCVVEGTGVQRSLANALRRAFGRGSWWRVLVIGLAVISTYSVPYIVLYDLTFWYTHSVRAFEVERVLLAVLSWLIAAGVAVVAAADLRLRAEGDDLESALVSAT
jgi:hypothetical protein